MLTEMETMTELSEIKSEIGSGDYHGSGSGSVDTVDSNSTSVTPQPHINNFSWVSSFNSYEEEDTSANIFLLNLKLS